MELEVIQFQEVGEQSVLFSIDLNSVNKTPEEETIFFLSRVKSETRNIWQLIVFVELVDGLNEKLISKEFRIKTEEVSRKVPARKISAEGTSTK